LENKSKLLLEVPGYDKLIVATFELLIIFHRATTTFLAAASRVLSRLFILTALRSAEGIANQNH